MHQFLERQSSTESVRSFEPLTTAVGKACQLVPFHDSVNRVVNPYGPRDCPVTMHHDDEAHEIFSGAMLGAGIFDHFPFWNLSTQE